MPWQIDHQPSDTLIRSCLAQHRAWSAYALGDLHPPFRNRSTFRYASHADEWAIVLFYRTATFNALIPFGPPEGVAVLLEAEKQLPRKCIISNGTADMRPVLERWYTLGPEELTYRMVVSAARFKPFESGIVCEKLDMRHIGEMSAFYTMNNVPTFSPEQVQHGLYCGIRRHGVLVAVGGTHFVDNEEHIAAIGNVYTDTILRGNGYARAIISTLISLLIAQGCREVMFNIARDDYGAQQRYQILGFEPQAIFWEADASRK